MKLSAFSIVLLVMIGTVEAQSLTQIIRGRVIDLDTKTPLIGVTLYIDGSQPVIGTITDEEGYFTFPGLPIGRYNIGISYIGYENKVIPNVLTGAGKEVVLNVQLEESVEELDEVIVTARKNKGEAINDMATVSARSITVEETSRFAGSFNDPSRLVSSYGGVMGDPDGNNDIIIRGNSPRGLQWRLEGVDVPNPNHFANEGATGGPISILNNTTLDNCDFFTGAFPADYGDSYSGVFDVHLRKGNNQKREFTAQVGIIGMDLTAEGPFGSNTPSSYLINYRYSSLDVLNHLGIKVAGDAVPNFQDMTFNVSVPTKRSGTFQIFGVGGKSNIDFKADLWKEGFEADLGIMGVNHIYPLSEKSYLKTSFSFTGTLNNWTYYESEMEPPSWILKGNDDFTYTTYAMSIQLAHKFSAKNTIKTGITGKLLGYDLGMKIYDYDNELLYTSLTDNGTSELFQSFVNWKFKPVTNLTFNTGFHFKYFNLNGDYSMEPRLGMRWQMTSRQAITAGFGMHSKTDNISLYLIRERLEDGTVVQQNKDLDFLRAMHYVIGYENRITRDLNMKIEAYYQDLYNVPVSNEEDNFFSILNASDGYIITKLVNEGSGKNYGIELSIDKYFSKNYYFLVTTSLFESKFTAFNHIERNTRFDNNYIFNVVGGKEFPLGRKKNSAINLNVRGSYAGGQWYTPIDVEASQEHDYTVRDNSRAFQKQYPDYIRFDLKLSYRRNKKNTTRVWEIDIENVTNASNVTGDYWDSDKDEVVIYSQLGILPVLNYRIEF